MAETPTDVLVAVHQELDEAAKDPQSLVGDGEAGRGRHPGDARPGRPCRGSADGRRARSQGVAVGQRGWLAVGLFAPPLLASVAVGAVEGGVIGECVDHPVEQEIHDYSDTQGERNEPESSRR